MPILDLQRRMRQLGEIRIGHVVPTGRTRRDGKPGTRPAKLDKFRFTSPSREILAQVAALYGGEVQPWTPANGGPAEFEVYSQVNRLPVLIPPRDAVSQWYEQYQGSKCVRRCDGQTEFKSDRPCLCNPERRQCAITTRVNVMLRDVPALGQWLLVSKGYYAAVTLPPAAELLAQTGGYVAGWLGMEEKLVHREEGPARFMVPTLDVEIAPAALMKDRTTGGTATVEHGPERVALLGGRPDYAALAAAAGTSEEVGKLWTRAHQAGHLDDALAAALKTRAAELGAPAPRQAREGDGELPGPQGQSVPAVDEDGAVEAEVVEDDVADIWFQIIAAAGPLGLTTDQVEQRFAEGNDGLHPSTASADRLRRFLAALKGGKA
ncbi:hypothetical protein [Streptomyces sp. AV19]|uniref:recombination directionality factor n=1 Tax=Streptomyces sp. AV19 TaxID=2793068 RepID=UPI0024135795|nr:hypothetical protein [Streptomyces sp. AV19]MDG4535273.1 hypothetical protein [Streptomyces sp. AV19]